MNKSYIKEIVQDLEKRNSLFIQSYNKRVPILKYMRIGAIILWLLAIINYFDFLIKTIDNQVVYDMFKYDILYPVVFMSVIVVHQYFLGQKIPEQRDKKNYETLWTVLRTKYIFNLLLYFLIIVFSFLWRPVGTIATSFIIIAFVLYLIYVSTIIAIKINPKLILSGLLNQVGSTCHYLAFLSYGYYALFSFLVDNDSVQIKIVGFIITTIAIVILLSILKRAARMTGLMPTQFDAIQTIKPSRLIISLRTEETIVNDKGRAIELLKEIKQDVGYGVQAELIKLVVKENTRNKKRLIGPLISILIPVLIFISTSIGRAFIQDLIYRGHLKKLLCKFFEAFC